MNGELWHFGRSWSWSGTAIEDGCRCAKAPCGLVVADRLGGAPDCPEHGVSAMKTIRQMHPASECPAANPADDLVECARARGVELLPWQERVLREMFRRGPDGSWEVAGGE